MLIRKIQYCIKTITCFFFLNWTSSYLSNSALNTSNIQIYFLMDVYWNEHVGISAQYDNESLLADLLLKYNKIVFLQFGFELRWSKVTMKLNKREHLSKFYSCFSGYIDNGLTLSNLHLSGTISRYNANGFIFRNLQLSES